MCVPVWYRFTYCGLQMYNVIMFCTVAFVGVCICSILCRHVYICTCVHAVHNISF